MRDEIIVFINIEGIKKLLPDIRKDFVETSAKPLRRVILRDILSGVSPVQGKRFRKYTRKYRDKKKTTPNLWKSGDLLRSFYTRKLRTFRGYYLAMGFSHELADIHNNKGPSGSKRYVRRMLPTKKGERFNTNITQTITNLLEKSVSRIVKKNR